MTLRFRRRRRFETAQVVIEAVLTAYHGTRNGGFDDFKSHYRKGEQLGFGIHFSADREFAARYAHDDEVARKGKAPMVYTVQLTMDRPLKADEIVSEGSPEFALAKKLAGAKLYVSKDEHGTPCCYMQNAIDSTSPQRAEKLIRAAGFDGVIYRARVGSRAVGGMMVSGESESYIVFEPSQIRIVSKESLAEAESQTSTPEFQRWFDKSKVVDSNGKPLIVYHGTKKDFSTFDSGRFGTFDHGTVGIGIYATSNKEIANNYTHTVVGNVRVHDGGNVMPMYMRIVNPIGFDDAMKIKMQLVNDLIASGESWAEVEKSIGRRLTAHLKELGYDGVSPTDGEWEGVGDSWTAFSPAQVKSAIGNSGSFDPASNKITDAVHADIDATIRHLS